MTVLADRIGEANALLVIAAAGGERIAVPALLDAGNCPSTFARRFGPEIGVLLILHFGGSAIYIPHGRKQWKGAKAATSDVVRMTRRGKTASQIAKTLGCSERTVYAKRAKARLAAKRKDSSL